MVEILEILQKSSKFAEEARSLFKTPKSSFSNNYKYDIGIVTATEEEFYAVIRKIDDCKELEENINDSTIYYHGKIKVKNSSLSALIPFPHSMGIESAVSTTSKMLSNFTFDYLFMVGICAGNKNVTNIGDVIIAEKSLNYNEVVEIQKESASEKIKFRQNADSIDKNFKSRLSIFIKKVDLEKIKSNFPNNQIFEKPLKCHIGLMVTGSSLLRNDEKINEINRDYHGLKGMDMETNGFYFTVSHSLKKLQPKFVAIKSVSDFGDSTKHKISGEERKEYALYTCTETLFSFIENSLA